MVRDVQEAGIAEAANGREAIALARHYEPDVVLMDVVMPALDGIAATRRIVADGRGVRVVVLTGSSDDEVGLLALQAGASGGVTKTAALRRLPATLAAVRDGEAATSRRLTTRLVERLQAIPADGHGLRPVRSTLTDREWEVLNLLCAGASTEDIAEALVLAGETVRSHVKGILRKLGVASRAEAVAVAGRLREPWAWPPART